LSFSGGTGSGAIAEMLLNGDLECSLAEILRQSGEYTEAVQVVELFISRSER